MSPQIAPPAPPVALTAPAALTPADAAPAGAAPAGTRAAGAAQALFKEARRRRWRRWLAGTAAVLVLSAAAAATAVTWPHSQGRGSGGGWPGVTAPAPAARSAVATAVWFDDSGLHVGDIFPGGRVTQRFVAELNADLLPLVRAGQRVYWVDPAGAFVPAFGTADGIVVQSAPGPGPQGVTLALWNPASEAVTVVGRARAVIGAYTPPGARYSLLAWLPADCPPRAGCPVEITNTATRAARTVRSPQPGGFAMGGAFSPDGSRLALFLNTSSGQEAQLALADVATAAVRVAATPRFPLGVDIAWARWLPGGTHLIAGPMTGASYLVDSATLSAEPLLTGAGHRPGPDINYTTAVIPRKP